MVEAARRANFLCLIVSFLTIGIGSADASPWGRAPGAFFLSSRFDYFSAAAAEARFERYESNTYGEIGLPAAFTIGGKVVYGTSIATGDLTPTAASGVSEAELFLQRELIRKGGSVVALKLTGASPTRFAAGARPGFVSDGADLEARVLYGATIVERPLKVFATAEAGYRRRFGDGADQVRLDGLVGVAPTPRLLFLGEVLSSVSARNEQLGGSDFDIVRAQSSAVVRFSKRWAIQGGASFEFAGRNVLLGETYFVGLWTEF